MAKKVVTTAAPELTAAVKAGKITVGDALRVVDQPPEKPIELVTHVKTAAAKTLARAPNKAGGAPAKPNTEEPSQGGCRFRWNPPRTWTRFGPV